MDLALARDRFAFLARAFEGSGGFCPRVTWASQQVLNPDGSLAGTRLVPSVTGTTELVRYQRESDEKFAGRNAIAIYENHLRTACERFVSFLGRRRPQRANVDAPLVKLFIDNADLRGSGIDAFFRQFALHAKARGSLLLVIDKPEGAPATSLGDQMARRKVPYVRAALPESIEAFEVDSDSGLFLSVTLCVEEKVDGKLEKVSRDYTTTGWKVRLGERVIDHGEHAFGACPVLAYTESGDEFPVVGKYAQIADLSRRLFNARSELDEILRSQTFSLLTLQVPQEQSSQFDAAKVSATIGTHSMLVHGGDQPAFIAPDASPAETYGKVIDALQQSIRRISMEESTESSTGVESGVARRLRFEALNADIATFAQNLQQLEMRMWELFHRALGLKNTVEATWPTDYNLADVAAELDILALMQATGFPPAALNAKRKSIAATEFDNAPDDVKVEIDNAIDEFVQQQVDPTTGLPIEVPPAVTVRTGATA